MELHTHRKVKETHELIFSWLSWLAVLLAGAYDYDGDDGGVVQHGGHTPNNGLTETFNSRKGQQTKQKYRNLVGSNQHMQWLEETELRKADRMVG